MKIPRAIKNRKRKKHKGNKGKIKIPKTRRRNDKYKIYNKI